MGLGGISIWQLLIILAIVIMIFGTKKLRTIGSDLGGAIKGFKKSMSDEESSTNENSLTDETKPEQPADTSSSETTKADSGGQK